MGFANSMTVRVDIRCPPVKPCRRLEPARETTSRRPSHLLAGQAKGVPQPGYESLPVSHGGKRERLVVQDDEAHVLEGGDGVAIDEPMTDDDALMWVRLQGTGDQSLDGLSDLPASLGHGKLVYRVIDRVDQPEAALLQLRQNPGLRLSSQRLAIKPQDSLGHATEEVVSAEVVGVEEWDCLPPRRGRRLAN